MEHVEQRRYSIDEFVRKTAERERGGGFFELETERLLQVNLDGLVWTKLGAMVAYTGDIRFEREGILEHGVGKLLKRTFTGEGARLTKARGTGQLYLADLGKKVTILELAGESIVVNGNDLLAFQDGIEWDIRLMRRLAAAVSGGLFNVKLTGHGLVAITAHYEPITMLIEPGRPVCTDPNATVAWSGNLDPEFRTDVQLKTFVGRGSGESIQMKFEGEGFVVIQPYEESSFGRGASAT